MIIYDYLFYKTYSLSRCSKNFDDVPVLGGLLFILPCLMFNIFTIFMLLSALIENTSIEFRKEYKYFFTFTLLILLLFYYLYKGRYKRIIEKFESKDKKLYLHPIIVIIMYYGISFGLLLLAGMYKNQDWIFAP